MFAYKVRTVSSPWTSLACVCVCVFACVCKALFVGVSAACWHTYKLDLLPLAWQIYPPDCRHTSSRSCHASSHRRLHGPLAYFKANSADCTKSARILAKVGFSCSCFCRRWLDLSDKHTYTHTRTVCGCLALQALIKLITILRIRRVAHSRSHAPPTSHCFRRRFWHLKVAVIYQSFGISVWLATARPSPPFPLCLPLSLSLSGAHCQHRMPRGN